MGWRDSTAVRPRRALAVALALGSVGVVAGCNGRVNAGGSQSGATAAAPPQTATVTRRDVTEQIAMGGQLIVPPPAVASAAAPFQSTVERVYKSVGQNVSRGEPVVKLALPTAEAAHQQTRADLATTKSQYDAAKRQYGPQVAAAEQQLRQAQAAVRQARQASPGSGPDAAAPGAATSGTDNLGATTGSPDLQTALQQEQQALQALEQVRQQRDQALAPYTQAMAQAGYANDQARADAKQGIIRAPIGGTITALNAQPGQNVNADPRAAVVSIVNLDAIQVQAPMTADQASRVKVGTPVSLTFDELPGKTFTGRIAQLTTQPNGSYLAAISFGNTGRLVKPAYHARVGIRTGRAVEDALAVPAAALALDNGKWVARVQRDGKWVLVQVTPGMSDGQFTSIQSGLSEGESVQVPPK